MTHLLSASGLGFLGSAALASPEWSSLIGLLVYFQFFVDIEQHVLAAGAPAEFVGGAVAPHKDPQGIATQPRQLRHPGEREFRVDIVILLLLPQSFLQFSFLPFPFRKIADGAEAKTGAIGTPFLIHQLDRMLLIQDKAILLPPFDGIQLVISQFVYFDGL